MEDGRAGPTTHPDLEGVVGSLAFRRLARKTQVFIASAGVNPSRMEHAVQVATTTRRMARALRLNEDLTEAIALGHDLGHPALGATGAEAFTPFLETPWDAGRQALRVLDLEGREISAQAGDGIRSHSWRTEPPPATSEGMLVRAMDRPVFLTHDVLDGLRGDAVRTDELPTAVSEALGPPQGWLAAIADAVVGASRSGVDVRLPSQVLELIEELRAFAFERVYLAAPNDPERRRGVELLRRIVEGCITRPETLPPPFRRAEVPVAVCAVDYAATLTDEEVRRLGAAT
jgi:dGTPase